MGGVLSASETQEAESLLGTTVRSAEPIRERNWILRLTLADGRTVVLKRDRASQDRYTSFAASTFIPACASKLPKTSPCGPSVSLTRLRATPGLV